MGADWTFRCYGCIATMCAVLTVVGIIFEAMNFSANYYCSSKWVSVYVQDLYVASTTTPNGGRVLVELKFEREKASCGLDYKDFEMTLLYAGSGIGSSVVEGFSMRRNMKRVDAIGKVEAVGMPWQALLPGNVGTMVVELHWPSDDNFRYTASVPVDASGHMKIKGPIRFEFHQP